MTTSSEPRVFVEFRPGMRRLIADAIESLILGPAMSERWFRVSDEALDDPRLQRLPASLFKFWFNVHCVASRRGGALPDLRDLAFLIRSRPGVIARRLETLKAAGLLKDVDGKLHPTEWERQRGEAVTSGDTDTAPAYGGEAFLQPISLDGEHAAPVPGACDRFERFWEAFHSRGDGDNPKAPALAVWRKAIGAGADPGRQGPMPPL